MEQVRPLRDVFDDLAGRPGAPGGTGGTVDPAAALDVAGHPGLPGDLVAEALVSYAATAPPQVAEQLTPFVTAHSGVPAPDDDLPELPDPVEGLALLDGAAAGDGWDDPLDLDAAGDLDAADALDGDAFTAPAPDQHPEHPVLEHPVLEHSVLEQPVGQEPAGDDVADRPDHGFGTGAQEGPDGTWAGFGDAGPAPDPTSDGWLSLDPLEPEDAGQLHDADPARSFDPVDPSDPFAGIDGDHDADGPGTDDLGDLDG